MTLLHSQEIYNQYSNLDYDIHQLYHFLHEDKYAKAKFRLQEIKLKSRVLNGLEQLENGPSNDEISALKKKNSELSKQLKEEKQKSRQHCYMMMANKTQWHQIGNLKEKLDSLEDYQRKQRSMKTQLQNRKQIHVISNDSHQNSMEYLLRTIVQFDGNKIEKFQRDKLSNTMKCLVCIDSSIRLWLQFQQDTITNISLDDSTTLPPQRKEEIQFLLEYCLERQDLSLLFSELRTRL